MKKRIISLLLVCMMILSLLPTVALAVDLGNPEEWDTLVITKADGTKAVKDTDYSVATNSYNYIYDKIPYHVYTILTGDELVISGGAVYTDPAASSAPQKSKVNIASSVESANITLNGVTALASIEVAAGKSATFTLVGENHVDGIIGGDATGNSDATLTFRGEGTLVANHIGGASKYGGNILCPKLIINGGNYVINGGYDSFSCPSGYVAGIGGGQYCNVDGITINGGTISVQSNYGAAIGGGQNGYAKNITINGGTINAKGSFGAAIGGGQNGIGEDITINGGTLVLKTSRGGIGGGQSAIGKNISITGGDITIIDGAGGGALIGGGQDSNAEGISITGGKLRLETKHQSGNKEYWNVGIGAGSNSAKANTTASNVTISNADIAIKINPTTASMQNKGYGYAVGTPNASTNATNVSMNCGVYNGNKLPDAYHAEGYSSYLLSNYTYIIGKTNTVEVVNGKVVKGTFAFDVTENEYVSDTSTVTEKDGVWTVTPPTVNIGGETETTAEVIVEQKSEVNMEGEGVTEEIQKLDNTTKTAITQNTSVSGVNLTTEAAAEAPAGTESGLQAVVNAAVEANAALAAAIASAETVSIEVKVNVHVVPTEFKAPVAADQGVEEVIGTVTFELKPTATVTVGEGSNAKSETVDVDNSMIDTSKPITVSIYTGFKPVKIVHTGEGGFEEVFRETGSKTFTYDETTKVCTLTISHFSALTAVAKEYVAQIEEQKYETLAEAFAAVNAIEGGDPVTMVIAAGTFAPTANDQFKVTRSNVTVWGAGVDATILDYGTFSCSGQAGLLVQGDNVTVKDLTVKSDDTSDASKNISAIKVSKIGDGTTLPKVSNVKLENVKAASAKSHGLNLHGVENAVVTGVTATGGKCGISLAAADVTISSSNVTGSWGSIGMMYGDGGAYSAPVTLTLGAGNTIASVYSERPATATGADSVKLESGVSAPAGLVAKIDNVYYPSLANAINAAKAGETIKLIANCATNKAIEITKSITLDLGTYTVAPSGWEWVNGKGNAMFAVRRGATLTIDGTTGKITTEGTFKSPATTNDAGKLYAAVCLTIPIDASDNENAAGIVVNGGTLEGYYYGIVGNGSKGRGNTVIAINGGTVKGLKANDSDGIFHPQSGTLTITDGTIEGGSSGVAIKSGSLTMTGGELICKGADNTPTEGFSNGIKASGAALQIESNSGYTGDMSISISGNVKLTSANSYALYEYVNASDPTAVKSMSITGGMFSSGSAKTKDIMLSEGLAASDAGKDFISGGYFTSDPSNYVRSDYAVAGSNVQGYAYMVAKVDLPAGGNSDIGVVSEQPKVDCGDRINPDYKETVETTAAKTEVAGLGTDALKEAAKVNAGSAKAELEAALGTTVSNTVTVFAQTYLDVKPQEYDAGTDKVYTVDITPKVQLIASTAENAAGINTTGQGGSKNAVALDDATELKVTTPVVVTIPLPANFANENDILYVKHIKDNGASYLYKCTVQKTGDQLYIQFVNNNGFSKFEITTNDTSVASIVKGGSTLYYTSLRTAVEAVANGETITLTANCGETVTVGRDVSFTLNKNGKSFNGDIKAGANTTRTINGSVYIFDYTTPTPVQYSIDALSSIQNGSVTVNKVRASVGSLVTITVTPDEGYKPDTLTVKDANGDALTLTKVNDTTYTFKMPIGKVTVSATFTEVKTVCPQDETCVYAKFTDADTTAWYHDGVHYCVESGLMKGVSDVLFAPDGTTTRAMIVTMLWRMEGEPVASYAMSFKDVKADQWFTEAIRWAQSTGVVEGYSAEAFGPDDPITREQMATILYRYAKYQEIDVANTNTLAGFTDADKVSSWALDAMKWANAAGLVQGRTTTTLVPDAEITRAEAATMVQRYCENVSKD